jgi:D-glycero-alpha-D-manno-heptose-7-phosphate kinase
MKELVDESIDILASGMDIRAFGDLLHEAWMAKRSLSSRVSNTEVDELYDLAREAGALGGKLTGAGGGGFMLLFVEPDRQPDVLRAMESRIRVPFAFESAGSQIVFYEPETDYHEAERARQYQPLAAFKELSSPSLTAEAS